jgi:hypothetical protein
VAQPDASARLPTKSDQPGRLNERGLRDSPLRVSDSLLSGETLISWTDQGSSALREMERFEGVVVLPASVLDPASVRETDVSCTVQL